MTNKILRHRYKIISELGKGGFGTTYLAVDLDLPNHPQCVVKQLAPSDPRPQVFQIAKTLFEKEAITLQRLGEHPQIPRLFAYFEADGQFYLVQEFIPGDNLTKEIYLGKKISEKQAVQLLTEILSVLKYVHQQNVIHRDLKPQNIMRRKSDGKIVLIDFGAVKEIKGLTVTSGGHTTNTIAVGTPGYMPGEQAAGQPRFCSDIYAVGMMAIEALTGMPVNRLEKDQSTGEIIWKNQVNVSEKLGNILDKMVSDYWRHRYQTTDEIMVELNDHNYVNNQSQQKTVLIHKNKLNNDPSTVLPSASQSSTTAQTWGKIGIGIASGIILFSIIIPNILSRKETSSPSPTTNNQNGENLIKYTPNVSEATDISTLHTLTGHNDWIRSVAISSDGQTIVSGSYDKTIKVWDLGTGNLKNTLTGNSDRIFSVTISPDGQTIVSGSADGTIKIWDMTTGSLKNTLTGHSNSVYSVAISPDGETIVSGSGDGTIKVWDMTTGSLKATLVGHSKEVWSVAISPDGETIVSGSEDKTIKIWELATGSLKTTLTGHTWVVTSVAITPDQQTIISSSDDKTIKVWSDLHADYSKLEKLLTAGKWKEADRETENIMLEVANRKSEAWLDSVSISTFPCSDLRKIDQLWLENSDSHFGFTVQKSIYLQTGNQPINFQEEPYKLFGKAVGWYQNERWLKYDELGFNFPENSPKGHLPAPHRERTSAALAPYHYLMDKLIKCNI